MIGITFTAPLLERDDYVFVDDGTTFFKGWLKAYNPKKGVIFLNDNWDFRFEECSSGDTFIFSKKNDPDIMVIAGRIKSIARYEQVKVGNYVGATGIEPVSSRM